MPNTIAPVPFCFLQKRFTFRKVTRAESASPSTGSRAAHRLEQAELIDEALANL